MNTFLFILIVILLVVIFYEILKLQFKTKRVNSFNYLIKNFHIFFGVYFFLALGLLVFSRLYSNEPFSGFFQFFVHSFPVTESVMGIEYDVGHRLISKLVPVFFVFILLFVCIFLITNKNLEKVYFDRKETPVLTTKDIWFSTLIVVLILSLKESISPFYFTQDDTHSQFLPKILVGIEMLLGGEFPFIDNYQHFGAPLFEIGTYAILDPIMIFSYLVAKYLLGNSYLTIEVYSFACTIIGAVFFGYSLKVLRVDYLAGIAGIICFFLLPYFFIVGRSWYYVFGIVCYLPIILYFLLLSLCGKGGFIWFLGVSIFRGLFFYTGNSQFFLYGAFIEFIAYFFLLFKYKSGQRIFLNYFCSLLFTLGLILPLLLSQTLSAVMVERPVEGIISRYVLPIDALVTSFIPAPFFKGTPTWGNKNWSLMPNLWYVGFIWIFCFYLGLVLYIKTGKGSYKYLLVFAAFIFLLSFGPLSLIYPIKHFIPIVNKMHKAYKLFPFAMFLVFLYGVLILSEIRKIKKFSSLVSNMLIVNVILNIVVALTLTDTAFYTYKEIPYPKLQEPLVKYLSKDDIIYAFANIRYEKKPYVTLLPHNYSCLYDLMVVNIYDPLLPTSFKYPSPKTQLKDYFASLGVTKVILQKASVKTSWRFFAGQFKDFDVLYEDKDFILYEVRNPKWLLWPYSFFVPVGSKYLSGVTPDILSYTRSKLKAKINSQVKSGWLYHNEFRKGYYIKINGEKHPIKESRHMWCYFELPKGENLIEIGYTPPLFLISVYIGLFLIFLSGFFYKRYIKPVN